MKKAIQQHITASEAMLLNEGDTVMIDGAVCRIHKKPDTVAIEYTIVGDEEALVKTTNNFWVQGQVSFKAVPLDKALKKALKKAAKKAAKKQVKSKTSSKKERKKQTTNKENALGKESETTEDLVKPFAPVSMSGQ